MHGYAQPADYKFSHDSIELASRAAALLRLKTAAADRSEAELRVLDLCAGCGVVGLEFAKTLSRGTDVDARLRLAVDFVEVQSVYREYFEKNRESFASPSRSQVERLRWFEMNYESLLTPQRTESHNSSHCFANFYDLVLANPPYFDREQGSLPPSDFKARCRFFLDSDFETMLRSMTEVLKPAGFALFLVRDLGDHGMNRASALDRILKPRGNWSELDPIRGTGLVLFEKAPKNGAL